MAVVHVNGKAVDIGNDRLNVIQAADRAGVFVPHYCWHPALSVVASCRMCLVEVGEMKDGKTVMQPKVVPGCQTPVKDGMVIVTDSPKAKNAQAATLEGLLLNHPLDCPVCDKAGECKLQDFSFKYGKAESRMIDEKNQPPNKPNISSKITLFTDRCIMCTRCVRFTREIAGTAELQVVSRGHHSEIDVFPGRPLENKLSGNVVDLCPVGALGSKDFLYKQRVWYLKSYPSVCAGCSTGCSVEIDTNKDIVYRLRPRYNPQAQGHFMCDEGRWGYHYTNSHERLGRPMVRTSQGLKPIPWKEMNNEIAKSLEQVQSGSVVALFSPFLTVEEAYLFATYLQSLSLPNLTLASGPIPIVGTDDTYPKNWKGEPVQPVKFTIRAEKAPNRRGVEEVLKHFQSTLHKIHDLSSMTPDLLWVTSGYPHWEWVKDEISSLAARSKKVILQDIFFSDVSKVASLILPAATWAEKEGTFVNYSGLAQLITRSVRSPKEAKMEGQVYFELQGKRGLLQSGAIREEIAQTIPYFSKLKNKLPEWGISLETTESASLSVAGK